jgi:hypothetical protein
VQQGPQTTAAREKALLTIAVIFGSLTAIAVAITIVLVAVLWWDAGKSSTSEAAAYIVSGYGATSAHCQGAGPDKFSCHMTYRGCSVHGRLAYDGPGIYPWIGFNPMAACRGYHAP